MSLFRPEFIAAEMSKLRSALYEGTTLRAGEAFWEESSPRRLKPDSLRGSYGRPNVSARKLCTFAPESGKPERRTADPSTTLRSGRDDNFVWER
jgi:hypothetical protein